MFTVIITSLFSVLGSGCFILTLLYCSPTRHFPHCSCIFHLLSHRHDALKLGKDFAKQTNCSVNNVVCLLSLTPQAVLTAQMKTSRKQPTPALAELSTCCVIIVVLLANDAFKKKFFYDAQLQTFQWELSFIILPGRKCFHQDFFWSQVNPFVSPNMTEVPTGALQDWVCAHIRTLATA